MSNPEITTNPLTTRAGRDELKRTLRLAKLVASMEREVRKQKRVIKTASKKFLDDGSMTLAESQAVIAPANEAKEAALTQLKEALVALSRQTLIFNPETETNIWNS